MTRDYLDRLSSVMSKVDYTSIDLAVENIRSCWESGRQIIALGNGGSALTALHYITDWNKMVFHKKRKPFRGRTLVDNIGIMTAYSNDLSYEDLFVEQLRNLAVPGDLVIAISGSGNSENVIRSVAYANEIRCETLALCGFSGGRLKKIAKNSIWIESHDMQICEDMFGIFGHIVMQSLCSES